MLTLTSLGGAGTVTGSKHLLTNGDKRILIDCGLFQGLKNLRELNWAALPVTPSSIDAVVLTHAHLDHSGYLPKLVRDGFRGRIYSTEATRDVAELILKDSGHLQEKDAEYANRKGFSKHKPALALYGIRDAEHSLEFFSPEPFDKPIHLPGNATLTFAVPGISWARLSRKSNGQGVESLSRAISAATMTPFFPTPRLSKTPTTS